MRHHIFGKKLSRTKNERKRLIEGLTRDIILHGTVTTTQAKAKAVQPLIEHLVTKAKVGNGAGVYEVRKVIRDATLYKMFMGRVADHSGIQSGVTRIIHIGPRPGDAAEMVRIGFIVQNQAPASSPNLPSTPSVPEKPRKQIKGKEKKPVTKKRTEKSNRPRKSAKATTKQTGK